MEIPGTDENFIIEKSVEGYDAEEIHYMLKNEKESYVSLDSVQTFLNRDATQEQVDLARRVQEKKADVGREELISDLREIKEGLKHEIEQLRESDLNNISNDTMKNLINNIKLMGEFIGELQQQAPANKSAGGVVNVNKLEQNFDITNSVQFLPAEEKRSIAEELASDPDVEDYVVVTEE